MPHCLVLQSKRLLFQSARYHYRYYSIGNSCSAHYYGRRRSYFLPSLGHRWSRDPSLDASSLERQHQVRAYNIGCDIVLNNYANFYILPLARYNSLSHIGDQPKEPNVEVIAHVKALLGLIAQHDLGHLIGIHSIHRHDPLPSDTVRLETHELGIGGASWTRATAIDGIDLNRTHATLFKLDQDTLIPLEFAAGPSPVETGAGPATNVPAAFLSAVADYLAKNGLADLLGLEVKKLDEQDGQGYKFMNELEIQWGAEPGSESFTILLPQNARARGSLDMGTLTPTGWYVTGGSAPADPDPVQPGTHYEKVVTGPKKETHKVVVTGGRSSAAITPALVLEELVNIGLIALKA